MGWSCLPLIKVNTPHRFRLDVWCHGRGETLSEVNFIRDRQSSPGEFTPPNAFVLHPYGRYCNANKFAGEIDLFEALDHIKKHYPIDDDRLVMRGFSMGGAACWQFAVHYPSMWAAAAPGAGFSETADFLKVFQNEAVQPTWYEKKLWHLYDCTDYALNLFNCPTVAYSGERDRQKQAADMMAKALEAEGIEMAHIIGAKAGHNYTPEARAEINRRIDSIAGAGRDPLPYNVHFTTWTLRYNRSSWVQIDGLEQHWERARVDGSAVWRLRGDAPQIKTKNVSALTLAISRRSTGHSTSARNREVIIDGDDIEAPKPLSDRSWTAHFQKVSGKWKAVASARRRQASQTTRSARPDRRCLHGQLHDGKADRPSAQRSHRQVDEHRDETRHRSLAASVPRRRLGSRMTKTSPRPTSTPITSFSGAIPPATPSWPRSSASSRSIGTRNACRSGNRRYDAGHHVPVLIYPNPLNPKRYVVLNSGFTFREYDYLNNARQVPKLPDFAVVDIDVPVSSRSPGGIVTAGFFTEDWGRARRQVIQLCAASYGFGVILRFRDASFGLRLGRRMISSASASL